MMQIKRYKNRKLYAAELSQYVTVDDIKQLVQSGHTVQVTDENGDDITAYTLVQVLGRMNVNAEQVRQLIIKLTSK